MKRWLSMILMIAVVLSALTVGASAADADDVEAANKVTLENGLEMEKLTDQGWTVTSGKNCVGNIIIPAMYEGLPVIAIGGINNDDPEKKPYEAFRGNSDLTGIVIPETVTEIGETAFASTGLRSLEIHNQMDTIGKGAFQQCTSLRNITFLDNEDETKLLTIEEEAFKFCTAVESVDFPQHNTNIGPKAFTLCQGLKDVFIWNGRIQAEAFTYCDNLARVAIAKGVAPIDATAFGDTTPASPSDPTNPDPDEDLHPNLPLIHYEGDGGAQEAFPMAGWPESKLHVKTAMERSVTPATCVKDGKFSRFIRCNEPNCALSGNGAINDPEKWLPALGHNYEESAASVERFKVEVTKHSECATWTWEYEVQCTRCPDNDSGNKHKREIIGDPEKHEWAEDKNPDREDEYEHEDATCAEDGYDVIPEICGLCDETRTDKKTLPMVTDQHTYHDKKTYTKVEVEPTCLYDGVEVTYLTCDGEHNEEGEGLLPCKTEDGKNCKDLLDEIKAKKTALEDAIKAYTAVSTMPGEDEKAPLEEERAALAKAVEEYTQHVKNAHEKVDITKEIPDGNEANIVDVKITTVEEDEHSCDLIALSEPVRTGPDGKSPYDDCVAGGLIKTLSFCPFCGTTFPKTDPIAPKEHDVPKSMQEPIAATCTEPPKIRYLPGAVCSECGKDLGGEIVDVPDGKPLGHDWDDFQPDPGQDTTQAEDCTEKEVTGTVSCKRDGCTAFEERTIVIPGKMGHSWGDWVVTKEATATEDGERTRTCSVCKKVETQTIPKGSTTPTEPDDPDNPDNPGKPDDPSKPDDPDTVYTITVVQGTGGTITVSRTSAKAGVTITVTVTPNSGYELDMIRVIGDTTATDLTGSRRSFTMPASNVKVQASFERIESGAGWGGVSSGSNRTDPPRTQATLPTQITSPASVPRSEASSQLFTDIPTNHWAAGEISWVNAMGYMGGTNGRFDPDGVITTQQVWMVLARLMNSNPTSMAEASRWAVINGFAEGGDPYTPMVRHQVVTALYRCAVLKGRASRPTGLTLAGYADSRLVPTVARDAMIWAVSSGIVTGDDSNRLNPTTTVTRAQFAVLLYRFSQRV